MRLQDMLLIGVAVAAAASVAAQAGAAARAAMHASGHVHGGHQGQDEERLQADQQERIPGVLTLHGERLHAGLRAGALQGRGVNTFRWIVNCATGKSYTDGTERFTGSVEGVGSGTFSWGVQSTGTFDCKKGGGLDDAVTRAGVGSRKPTPRVRGGPRCGFRQPRRSALFCC